MDFIIGGMQIQQVSVYYVKYLKAKVVIKNVRMLIEPISIYNCNRNVLQNIG